MTKPKQSGAFSGHRFPPEIIGYAVWASHRFSLSLRDVEDLLAARGVVVMCPAFVRGAYNRWT
jgi:putative transposase